MYIATASADDKGICKGQPSRHRRGSHPGGPKDCGHSGLGSPVRIDSQTPAVIVVVDGMN